MKKIYFVLILCVSSYGYSYSFLGVGSKNCSNYLDEAENTDSPAFYIYGSFAQGTLMTINMFAEGKVIDELGEKNFNPEGGTLKRVLMKHCEENLTKNYFEAVLDVWTEYAR